MAKIDPELRAGLAIVGGVFPPTVTPDHVEFMRRSYASRPYEELVAGFDVERVDVQVSGHLGEPIDLSVLKPAHVGADRPGIVFLHSGGLMFGDRFSGIDLAIDWMRQFECVLVTVEYRLAPQFADPYPREDCYAATSWVAEHAAELGIRADRILIAGASAGGGLAAGVALASRDRGGPVLCGQLLDYPMLDDRGVTGSTGQFDGIGVWDRVSNETGWDALLGEARGTASVSPYAAPARSEDLGRLPPAYIDVGAAEIFRDEGVAYAHRIWQAGGEAELHVWAGAFHACDIFAPHARVSRAMIAARNTWLEQMLAD